MFNERGALNALMIRALWVLLRASIYLLIILVRRVRISVNPSGLFRTNASTSTDDLFDLTLAIEPVKYNSVPSGSESFTKYANMLRMRLTAAEWVSIDIASSIMNTLKT